MNLALLKELCETAGISGREERLRAIARRELTNIVDEFKVDALGNLIAIKRNPGKPKVMLAAHMDEIGFIVTHIDKDGFVRFAPLGGHDPKNMVSQRVIVQGKEDLLGVLYPGAKPPHLQEESEKGKAMKISDFFIDLGLPVEKVKELVPVGSPVTIQRDFAEIGDLISAKSIDNRVAMYIAIQAMQQMRHSEMEIYAVFTSQEEVGVRGAAVSAFGIEPDLAIAIDTTIAGDIPGIPEAERVTKLGEGTAIKILDGYSISHPKVVQAMTDLAKKHEIRHQMEILPRGGTDAGGMQRVRAGAPTGTISIGTRYIHTSVETIHKTDLQACVQLLKVLLEEGHQYDYSLI